MFRRLAVAGLGVLLLASPAVTYAQVSTVAEQDNPINDQGSSFHYRSNVTTVAPSVAGVRLQVLEFADRLQLDNHSGQTVVVYGYEGEPYGRVLGDGTVELNTNSPAYYLNQNFYGNVTVPATASRSAVPRWKLVDRTGRLEWHDHRIHWMSPTIPPQVKDQAKRTKIFDWQVPIQVGARKGAVSGELFWTPVGDSKTPTGAIVALVAGIALALLFVLFVRRRRARGSPGAGSEDDGTDGELGETPREAW